MSGYHSWWIQWWTMRKDQGERIIFRLSDDPFTHLIAKGFNIFPGFVCEPHFLQGLYKRANDRWVDILLILDDYSKDLVPRGVVFEVFFNGFPEFESDGYKHSLSALNEIVPVKVVDKETMSSSVPNPRSCKGMDPLRNFTILCCYPVIKKVDFRL